MTPAPTASTASTASSAPAPTPSVEMDSGAVNAAFAAMKNGQPVAPTAAAPEAGASVSATGAVVEDGKPKTDAPAGDVKPKTGLDALPSDTLEEVKPDAAKPDAAKPDDLETVDTKGWAKAQRDAFATARVKEKQARLERDTAQQEVQALKQKIEKLESSDQADALKELGDLRSWKYATDVRESPEWDQAVVAPANKVYATLAEIAEVAGIDADVLKAATDEPSDIKRSVALKRVFDAAENPVDTILVTRAMIEADKLPDIWRKAEELEANAEEAYNALASKRTAEQTQQQKTAEAEYVQVHTDLAGQVAAKWPSLTKDPAVAEALKNARPGEDAHTRAMQVQFSVLLPEAVRQLHAARAKIAQLEKSEATLLGAQPRIDGNPDAKPANTSTELDEEAINAAFRKMRQ